MAMREDAINIAKIFLAELNPNVKADAQWKTCLFNEAKDLLLSGMNKDEILSRIYAYKTKLNGEMVGTLDVVLKAPLVEAAIIKPPTKQEDNLIVKDRFYFHPRLQVTPKMPTLIVDIERGIVESSYTKFYLEIVDKFSVEDLIQYATTKLEVMESLPAKNIGAINYLLKRYEDVKAPYNTLDLLLYIIDATSALMHDLDMPPLLNLLKLDDFIREGWQLYYDAYNSKKSSRLDKVIPR